MSRRPAFLPLLCLLTANVFAQDSGQSLDQLIQRGEQLFLAGKIEASVQTFEKAIQQRPDLKRHLWQLGMSYYYAGQYEEGRELFEHHQRVNRNDVENAAWHFLCVARLESMDVARKELLEIDTSRDKRVPMTEVYELFAGRGTTDKVLAAANNADTDLARMYAHLYLGLYYEASKQPELARKHLQQSAAVNLVHSYMQGAAKVHLTLLEKAAKKLLSEKSN